MKRILFFNILLCVVLAACTVDTTCHLTQKIHAGVTLDSMLVWNKDHTALVVTNQWDTVSVQGIGSDSLLYNHATKVQSLYLPLRADTNITLYTITWKQRQDTLYIRYINDFQYISFACGDFVYHEIDSTWSAQHFIQAAKIINPTVHGGEIENIRLTISE